MSLPFSLHSPLRSLWSTSMRNIRFSSTLTKSQSLGHPIPRIRATERVRSPEEFLKAIGRECQTKYTAPESWDDFWAKTDGPKLKGASVGIRDRRYILWCMEKFRQGQSIREFAHEPRPVKKIRGWGPKVQHGRRIRSKRIKTEPQGLKRNLSSAPGFVSLL